MADRPKSHVSHVTSTSSGSSGSGLQWGPCGGPILFTGPGGVSDYRPHLSLHTQAVGVGNRSGEATSDLGYLSRNAPGCSFPLAKHGRVGEIGWPVETFKIVKGI